MVSAVVDFAAPRAHRVMRSCEGISGSTFDAHSHVLLWNGASGLVNSVGHKVLIVVCQPTFWNSITASASRLSMGQVPHLLLQLLLAFGLLVAVV